MRWLAFGMWLAILAAENKNSAAEFPLSIEEIKIAFHQDRPVLRLPLPDGASDSFALERTAFLSEDCPYPVRTFVGRAAGNPACTARIVLTPDSLSAQIFSSAGTFYLDSRGAEGSGRGVIHEAGGGRGALNYHCLAMPAGSRPSPENRLRTQSAGHVLRTFRLAAAATAEFTEYFGSKEEAVRQVVIALHRAGGIFHRELGISFELVPGFEQMVFTDQISDPYSSNEPTEGLLEETQAAFDAIVGTANYDLGIVLTRGTFGLAYIRGVCDPERKGSSCIGLPEPEGDAFHILVAHELGHQFGANHTFNSPAGPCGERRNEWSAFEPGAGSTIMSYSSLPCGGDSFQSHHDDYFHSESIEEILDYVNSPAVSCGGTTLANNVAPTVSAGPEYSIPVGTPFALSGSGFDSDGGEITFCWEERDLGPAQALGAPDNGLSPLFRSYPPGDSPTRVFPALERILMGGDSPEERLPQTNRMLGFRLVARDSHDQGALAWADTQIQVLDLGGPFRITSHNAARQLRGAERIEWRTGGTTEAPISAGQVRISMSTNGGLSFPIVLAASTPNDGSETVSIPSIDSDTVRLKVEPTNNIFFDINDAPLAVGSGTELRLEAMSGSSQSLRISWPASPGTSYRLERASGIAPVRWNAVLRTNAAQSSISIEMPADSIAAFYRLVQE